MTENEKIIKMIYEDGSFPLSYADKIKNALMKTDAVKILTVNHMPPEEDRSDIECLCPCCRNTINCGEHLDHDIYCTNCGHLLTDWDELTYADPNVIAIKGGDKITLTMSLLDNIATYMDDEKREEIHNEFAPCEPIVFLKEYLKIDPDFEALLNSEFSIEL